MKMNKSRILATLLMVAGLVSATAYPENNTVQNAIYATYDLVVAVIEGIIPYVSTFIGIGILMFVLGAFATIIALAVGLVTIFMKFGKK